MKGQHRRLTPLALSTTGLFLIATAMFTAASTLRAESPASTATSAEPISPDELQTRIIEVASKGRLVDPLIADFKRYTRAQAQEKLGSRLPEDFWTWLDADRATCDGFLVELHPLYKPAAPLALQALREKFPAEINDHRQLALAFALVYGGAGKRPVNRRPRAVEVAAPTMDESFDYYLKHEKLMRFPLRKTPWPLLVYVADNDLPIEERQWALARYQKLPFAKFGDVYYEVPYDGSAVGGKNGKLEGKAYTLANILNCGGVCGDRAYYADRIFKSLGVPAMYDSGMGARGGHAWIAWLGPQGRSVEVASSGRFDNDRYYTGDVWDPVIRKRVLDRDVELLLVAVQQSYDKYIDARIAAEIWNLLPQDKRAGAVGLLKDAVTRSPYCAEPWRLIGQAAAEGVIPQRDAEQIYDSMLRALAKYPDLTFEVLSKILEPRLAESAEAKEDVIRRNVVLLDKAFALYDKAQRPDLAVVLRQLQGKYLESAKRNDQALKLYVNASEQYADQHFGFLELFDRALALMTSPQHDALRLKYLDVMANKVPQYQSDFNKEYNLVNPAYVRVVQAYVEALRAAGKASQADAWQTRIKDARS